MSVRTLFSFSYTSDVKSLPGFVKGGRDKVPKELSSYASGLISGWSEKEIRDHVEDVATKSKNNLEISARHFRTPSYDSGMASFECQLFKYDFSVIQSEENYSQCIFTGVLEVEDIQGFTEMQGAIDGCFDFTFDKVVCSLPKGDRDLKELIYSLDDNKKHLSAVFDFSYENDFSSFQLVHKEERRIITVNENEIEVKFLASESIPEMIKGLKEVNKQISSATSQEYRLLSDLED